MSKTQIVFFLAFLLDHFRLFQPKELFQNGFEVVRALLHTQKTQKNSYWGSLFFTKYCEGVIAPKPFQNDSTGEYLKQQRKDQF